jgi:hypothetical protein
MTQGGGMTETTLTDTTRILRFEVPVDDRFHPIQVPRNGVLHVGCRNEAFVEFWIRENHSGTEMRAYQVFGTGQPIPEGAAYEGTAIAPGGRLVWHLLSAAAGSSA